MDLKSKLYAKRNEVFSSVVRNETVQSLLEFDEILSINCLLEIKTDELDKSLKQLEDKMNELGVSFYTLKEQIEDQIAEGNETVAIDIFCMISLEEL